VVPTAQLELNGIHLLHALRGGGYVLIIRHPSSPRKSPTHADAHLGNQRLERQLDVLGSQLACAMGASIKRMAITLSAVYSSPAFRAREALELAGFQQIIIAPELDELQLVDDEARALMHTRWLQAQSAQLPPTGTNTLLMTHLPNLLEAFSEIGWIEVGETLVFRPTQAITGMVIARLPIEEWPRLALLLDTPLPGAYHGA